MFDRKLSTNWINLCQDHEQRNYAVLYCDLIEAAKTEGDLVRSESCLLKIQGEYVSLFGSSKENQIFLTRDLLFKFLVHEVSEIRYFETRKCHEKTKFWATFLTRSANSEEFLFDLRNWPLGVQRLNFWNFKGRVA